jgi:hypothetical protein
MKNEQQYLKGNYGFKTLSWVVDDFMKVTFNDGRKYYLNFLSIARSVWKELYWKELKAFKQKRIEVDKSTGTARLPADYIRWQAVGLVDDCNNIVPLSYNPYFVTAPKLKAPKGCGCTKCSCDSDLCGVLAGLDLTYEDVVYGEQTFQRIIKSKVCENGDLIREITEPFLTKDADDQDVIAWRTRPERVTKVEVSPCGCVIDTPENRKTCIQVCGHFLPFEKECCETPLWTGSNKNGKFKIDEDRGVIWLMNVKADKVILSYTSDGEDDCSEIIIPEYAVEAVKAGIYFHSIRYRKMSDSEKEWARKNFSVELEQFLHFLWPIVPHEMRETEDIFYKW